MPKSLARISTYPMGPPAVLRFKVADYWAKDAMEVIEFISKPWREIICLRLGHLAKYKKLSQTASHHLVVQLV